MPPVRIGRRRKVQFTVPYHRFLGLGTNLHELKYLPALNKLDLAVKKHDFNYADPKTTTKEADEQFYHGSEDTGLLGSLSRAALTTKSALEFDEYFGGSTSVDNTIAADTTDGNQIMADQDASTVADSDPGSGNGWEGSSYGGQLPPESGNSVRSYVIKRRFKHLVKTTNMNDINGHFPKYIGNEKGIHNVGHFCWAEPEAGAGDYIVPYFLTTWVTIPKWEATIRHATAYRVKSQGCGEWLTKNNEEVFVPNPEPYFDIYVDRGQYIYLLNSRSLTKVPNQDFSLIQP